MFTPKRYTEQLGELMAKVRCAAQGLDVCATAVILRRQKESLDLQSKSLYLQERMSLTQEDLRLHVHDMTTKLQQALQAHHAKLQRLEQLQSLQICWQMDLASAIACESLQPFLRDHLRGRSCHFLPSMGLKSHH